MQNLYRIVHRIIINYFWQSCDSNCLIFIKVNIINTFKTDEEYLSIKWGSWNRMKSNLKILSKTITNTGLLG